MFQNLRYRGLVWTAAFQTEHDDDFPHLPDPARFLPSLCPDRCRLAATTHLFFFEYNDSPTPNTHDSKENRVRLTGDQKKPDSWRRSLMNGHTSRPAHELNRR